MNSLALEPGRNCWRIERAGKALVIVDAADYFRIARQAMMAAQHQILLIGWDFDARIALLRDEEDGSKSEWTRVGPAEKAPAAVAK